jgi:hypothetical protein
VLVAVVFSRSSLEDISCVAVLAPSSRRSSIDGDDNSKNEDDDIMIMSDGNAASWYADDNSHPLSGSLPLIIRPNRG